MSLPEIHHLSTGARARLALVRDDADRFELVARVREHLNALLLAYCVMDTHVHFVVEGPAEHTERWLAAALTAYVRAFRRRHRLDADEVLRGPIHAYPAPPSPDELARTIHYVHENPVAADVVADALHYEWSSARAFAGLSLAGFANVPRAVELLGPGSRRFERPRGLPSLAGLDPAPAPTASPALILSAAAEVYGVPPWVVASSSRADVLDAPRALFLRHGQLESYGVEQLAPFIGKSRATAYRCLRPVPDRALQISRTLLAMPAVRVRLGRRAVPAVCVGETETSHLSASRARNGVR